MMFSKIAVHAQNISHSYDYFTCIYYYHYNFTNFLLLINCTAKFTKLKQSPLPRWLMTRTWIITWSALKSGSTTWGRRDGIPLRARKTLVNTASLLFNKCLYIPKSTSFFFISLPKRKTNFYALSIKGTKKHKWMNF